MTITVITAPEYTNKFQMAVYKQAIKALLRGMQINTGYTTFVCTNYVTKQTGTLYPSSKKGLQWALDDIEKLIKEKSL